MATTPAAISFGRADGNGPTQDADPPTGSRMRSSRPGRSFFPVRDRRGRLAEGFDPAAYDGLVRLPATALPGSDRVVDGRSHRRGDRRHWGDR